MGDDLFFFEVLGGGEAETFRFHSRGFDGTNVDEDSAVIRNVSLITGGVIAEGHDLEVDARTLEQVFNCAVKAGQIPVKLNHSSGVENICGYLTNFKKDGNKVRGDWFLLTSHDETPKMLERAKRMPGCFGMSISFQGKGEVKSAGRKAARCSRLLSTDCVTQPAANPDGLFDAKGLRVDMSRKGMSDDATKKGAAEPTLGDLLDAINGVREAQADMAERLEAAEAFQHEVIAALGDGSIDEAEAHKIAQTGEDGGELSALQNAVIELQSHIAANAQASEDQEVFNAFSVIQQKADLVCQQNEALTELSARQEAHIEALEEALRTSGSPVRPGVESHLFSTGTGEVHEFQRLVQQFKAEGKTDAQAIKFAVKANPRAHRAWVESRFQK